MTKKINSSKKKPAKTTARLSKTTKKTAAKSPSKKTANASKKILSKKQTAKTTSKAKKVAIKQPAKKVNVRTKTTQTKTSVSKKTTPRKSSSNVAPVSRGVLRQTFIKQPKRSATSAKLTPFLTKQRQRLLLLKDTLLDSMKGVARDNLHAGSDASAFGMHQADAGSDAYDRDFALSILSQEQNSLYEIDEALKRIDDGTYGVCEVSNKAIPRARLEALPFTRFTVECQAELEKRHHFSGARLPVSSLFGLTEEESENDDDENIIENTKD